MWIPKNLEDAISDAQNGVGYRNLANKYGGTIKQARRFKETLLKYGAEYLRRAEANQTLSALEGEKTAAHASAEPLDGIKQTFSGDLWTLEDVADQPIRSLEDLLRLYNVDTDVWDVERWSCEGGSWQMGAKEETVTENEKGKLVKSSNLVKKNLGRCRIKAVFRRKKGADQVLGVKDVIKRMFDEASDYAPVYKPILRVVRHGRHMLEINPIDHHLGKLAWKPESGQNYDLKIARREFEKSIQYLVSRVTATVQLDKIVLVLGNDLLQMDNPDNTTTAGTPVDVEGRFAKVYTEACDMIVNVVDTYLTPIADVQIIMVPGNHDRYTTFHLGEFLKAWYRNNRNVQIDNAPTSRKYLEFGENMFVYAHGDTAKPQDLPQLMATEQKQMWGRTTYRFAKVGHLHKKKVMSRIDVDEHYGVQVMNCPTLCAADQWHADNGYVGNMRRSEAHVYHEYTGHDCYFTYYAQND